MATVYKPALTAQSATTARPVVLFVLGFARSGTSALTRVLSLCGAALPARKLGADKSYPAGFWEPRAVVHLTNAILRQHRSAGFDPTLRLQEEGAFDPVENARWVARIRSYLTSLPAAPLVVIKDPKITVMSGMWFEAARQAGFDPVAVIAVRHPEESAKSVGVVAGSSPEFGAALWLKYSLLAERATRGLPRVFVEYTNLLDNWRREVKRIGAALPIGLDTWDEKAIDEFLSPTLRNHRNPDPVAELFDADWIPAAYKALSAAARDEPLDRAALDRVFEAYRAKERGFRTMLEDYHRLRKLYWRFPISTVKLFIEARAIAHRREETWA